MKRRTVTDPLRRGSGKSRWRKILPVALAVSSTALSACSTYNDDGELVRHHLGYVKVVTPAEYAQGRPVRALEVETLGLWVDVDGRPAAQKAGSGGGFGYRFDRRELIPKDCHLIVRLRSRKQITEFLTILKEMNLPEGGICAVRDSPNAD